MVFLALLVHILKVKENFSFSSFCTLELQILVQHGKDNGKEVVMTSPVLKTDAILALFLNKLFFENESVINGVVTSSKGLLII